VETVFASVKKVKGKAVLLQAWSGPEGSRKLRFPDFMTTAQDGGKVVSLMYQLPLPPGNTPGTHFCWRLSRPQGSLLLYCHKSNNNAFSSENVSSLEVQTPAVSAKPQSNAPVYLVWDSILLCWKF